VHGEGEIVFQKEFLAKTLVKIGQLFFQAAFLARTAWIRHRNHTTFVNPLRDVISLEEEPPDVLCRILCASRFVFPFFGLYIPILVWLHLPHFLEICDKPLVILICK
jgi:hypothetical protein